jgi:FkbM family methyltransferase
MGRISRQGIIVKYINDTRMMLRRGQHIASGIAYVGLFEFEEMAFALHFLRSTDLLVDVGANIGAYVVLGGGVVGARCIACEPVPAAFAALTENIKLNGIMDRVEAHSIGVGREAGVLTFSTDEDSVNHVIGRWDTDPLTGRVDVPVKSLDDILVGLDPALIKVDVEGFEKEVVAGASEVLSRPSLLALLIELNGSGYRYDVDEDEIHEAILRYGFRAYKYEPFTRSLTDLGELRAKTATTIYLRDIANVQKRIETAPRYLVNGRAI